MNKNYNHNDHESFMEGIYGCMERIEASIIELQKIKQSKITVLRITLLRAMD